MVFGVGPQLGRRMASSVSGNSLPFIFRQWFDRESCTYTYLLGDPETKEALIIDPVIQLAERDAQQVKDMGLNLKYVMNTHLHADHITGTGLLKRLLSCTNVKSVISKASGAQADVYVEQGDELKFGDMAVEVRNTPGHTNGCVSYVFHEGKRVFTGDAVLIRGCGRTDFQEGCSEILYNSVQTQIFSLPDDYFLYPAHDYKGLTVSTIGEEKKFNPRLTKPLDEFKTIMSNLNLDYPKQIDVALPANQVCGLYNLPDALTEKYGEKLKA